MRAQSIKVVCHFIFASDLSNFGDVIDFGVGVLCLDFSDGERTVSPEEVMKDVCDLDAHF